MLLVSDWNTDIMLSRIFGLNKSRKQASNTHKTWSSDKSSKKNQTYQAIRSAATGWRMVSWVGVGRSHSGRLSYVSSVLSIYH